LRRGSADWTTKRSFRREGYPGVFLLVSRRESGNRKSGQENGDLSGKRKEIISRAGPSRSQRNASRLHASCFEYLSKNSSSRERDVVKKRLEPKRGSHKRLAPHFPRSKRPRTGVDKYLGHKPTQKGSQGRNWDACLREQKNGRNLWIHSLGCGAWSN